MTTETTADPYDRVRAFVDAPAPEPDAEEEGEFVLLRFDVADLKWLADAVDPDEPRALLRDVALVFDRRHTPGGHAAWLATDGRTLHVVRAVAEADTGEDASGVDGGLVTLATVPAATLLERAKGLRRGASVEVRISGGCASWRWSVDGPFEALESGDESWPAELLVNRLQSIRGDGCEVSLTRNGLDAIHQSKRLGPPAHLTTVTVWSAENGALYLNASSTAGPLVAVTNGDCGRTVDGCACDDVAFDGRRLSGSLPKVDDDTVGCWVGAGGLVWSSDARTALVISL